jgi:hypothetical protein
MGEMNELAKKIELRVEELDKNLEMASSELFSTVCQENNLNSSILEEALSCDCPFGLIGFVKELEQSEISDYFNR